MLSGIGSIFMLHRTAPYEKGGIVYNEDLKISPDDLDVIIRGLKRKSVFLCMDEAAELLKKRRKPSYRFVAMTLDDGYKDNLTIGYPVFRAHNIPFCIYVTNCFPNKTANLWWYALEDLILNNNTLTHPSAGKLPNTKLTEKRRNFVKIRSEVLMSHFRDPIVFFRQLGNVAFNLAEAREEKCLTWADIKELSKDPLVTIGCHSFNHYPIARLNPPEARSEILHSKAELESRLKRGIKHFAFPFGLKREAGERDYGIARGIGFDSIVTTLHGNVRLFDDPLALKRISLSPMPNDPSLWRRELIWAMKTGYYLIKGWHG